jgi:hypothetical protein
VQAIIAIKAVKLSGGQAIGLAYFLKNFAWHITIA